MGNVSGEWIIYGVEWDNPEKAPYKHKKIMDFLWKKSILKRFVFYRQIFLFYSTSVVSGCNTTRFPEALRQITLG